MPLASPPPAAASYLRAINAACIHITPGPLVGATAGLPRQAIWAAWCKDLDTARKVATPDLLVRTCDDGIRVGRTVEQLAVAIEQKAKALRIALTPHADAVERALKLAMAVDGTLATLQARGDFKAFNKSYRQYRIETTMRGEKAMPYALAQARLRAVVVRALANTGRQTLTAPELHFALRAELPWYRLDAATTI
jgi:hypothetical protein